MLIWEGIKRALGIDKKATGKVKNKKFARFWTQAQ